MYMVVYMWLCALNNTVNNVIKVNNVSPSYDSKTIV